MLGKTNYQLSGFLLMILLVTYPIVGRGQISTTRHSIDKAFNGGYWIYATDFDLDGDTDIVAASLRSSLKWYQNDGTGAFAKKNITDTFKNAWSIHANDIDGDGDLDVVACSDVPSEIAWWQRSKADNFTKHSIDVIGQEPHSVYSADLDNDGDIDIMAALWKSDQIIWWENDGQQNFLKHVLDSNFSSAHSIHAADLDGDGDTDIMASGGGKTALWRNNGGGNFTKKAIGSFGAFCVFAHDINGDGRLDILRNQRNNGDIDWFENINGGASFTERNVEPGVGETWSIAAGDLDLDGDQDVVAAAFVPNKVSYWLNNGNENFTEVVLDANVFRPRGVVVADFDNDSDLDIAAVTRNDRLFWYEVLGSPLPPPSSITVASPNGGEILESGSNVSIQWSSTGAVNLVELEYSIDGGKFWNNIISNTPNTGSYVWTVPEVQSDSGRVRVSDSANPDTSDASDGLFSIVTSSLLVTSPNGGESWFGESVQTVTWNASGLVDSVRIEYSLDNGATWETIVARTLNTGSYPWTLPGSPSNLALVRVSDAADGAPTDVSDGVFSILGSSLTLTTPNGGESWLGGSVQTVTWVSAGTIDAVQLEYSIDDGLSWTPIIGSIPNNGNYAWTVPDIESSNALVQISDAADGIPSDLSNGVFSITASSLIVTMPNGGESWSNGTTQTLAWNSAGAINSVNLEYSINNGADWASIATAAANTGSFLWTVPAVESDSALIRISDSVDGTPQDVSDGVFSIITSSLTLTAPNGGESWIGGSTQTITWNATGLIDSVRLEYSSDNGTTWKTIVAGIPNSGSYDWTIPEEQSDRALVRVSDVSDGTQQDVSDALFAILRSNLTLTSPSEGENLLGGSSVPITWSSVGLIDSVLLKYSLDGGVQWLFIATKTPNSGSYTWSVPNIKTNNGLIRISDVLDGIPTDVSGVFSIIASSLTVTSPNGGESWTVGSERTITWHSTGAIDTVALEYSLNDGKSWVSIVGNTPNDGSYNWTVPNVPSDSVLVRISETADGDPVDASDDLFSITVMPTDVSIKGNSDLKPDQFALFQNYPNPFNLETRVDFALHEKAEVFLAIYNVRGKLVRNLFEGELLPGVYSASWNGHDEMGRVVTSGLYVYKIRIAGWQASKKLLLVK